MTLTEGSSQAKLFETEGAALEAGEGFCHANMDAHSRSNVDAAHVEGGWVAVITRDGNDFDEFLADCVVEA